MVNIYDRLQQRYPFVETGFGFESETKFSFGMYVKQTDFRLKTVKERVHVPDQIRQ